MGLTLRPYQEIGRDFLAARRHALLADSMRVGKTPQAILAAKTVKSNKTIIVCPAIAAPQWNSEWWRWWPEANHHPTVMSYDRLRINQDSVLMTEWDLAIVDECHFAKNPETQRTKLIYGKGGLGHKAKRMWVLSGTPATKSAADLWPMLVAFGVVGMGYSTFCDRYCTVNRFTGRITGTKVERTPELRGLLNKIMLRRTLAEVAPELPPIAFDFLNVDLAEPADVQIPDHITDAHLPAWVEAHAAIDSEDRQAVAMAKVPALVDHVCFALENELLEKTVVYGWHTAPLEALATELQMRGIGVGVLTGRTSPKQREWVQEQFKRGSIKVVVANILAAGTAIDLSVASHGYFLELDWLPANNVQAANRLVSMMKAAPVSFDVVTVPGSADQRIQKVLLTRARELATIYS